MTTITTNNRHMTTEIDKTSVGHFQFSSKLIAVTWQLALPYIHPARDRCHSSGRIARSQVVVLKILTSRGDTSLPH